MAVVDAQGTTLTYFDGTTAQTVGGVQSYGTIGSGTRTERDRTTLASTANEFGFGLKDNGTFTINALYDPADVGQAAMIADHNAASAVARAMVLTLSSGETRTFTGYVTEAPLEVPADGDVTVAYSVRITGAIVIA